MIVLASTSAARRMLLANAGVPFESIAAPVDERALEAPLLARGAAPAEIAAALADAKALSVSARRPADWVIGSDQVLDLDGQRFVKPESRAEAAAQLRHLSGRVHHLRTAVSLARAGSIVHRQLVSPRLTMRPLDDAAIGRYLDAAGEDALRSVGAYLLEGIGIQLFEEIEGDYFAILGLPLLPLLHALRETGALTSDEAP